MSVKVVAFVSVKPGQEDAFVEAAIPCVAASRAEAGVLHYDLWRETDGEQRYVFNELYVMMPPLLLICLRTTSKHSAWPHATSRQRDRLSSRRSRSTSPIDSASSPHSPRYTSFSRCYPVDGSTKRTLIHVIRSHCQAKRGLHAGFRVTGV